MRYMVHYNPTKNYRNRLYDFDTILNNLFSNTGPGSLRAPAVDIIENENNYVIEAEMPGFNQDEIDVKVEDNVLTISAGLPGEKTDEKVNENENQKANSEKSQGEYLVRERYSRSYTRSFSLPKDVDAEQIEGNYKNGILRLELTKKAEAKPRNIKVA